MSRNPKCMCPNCNNVGTVKVGVNNRGGRNGYLCAYHALHNESYTTENDYRKGVRKANGFTFSVELETSYSNIKARTELANLGYIPTHDGSISSAEFKSPIYEGLNAISKQLVSIDTLKAQGHLAINDHCGTHFHVGHVDYINVTTMGYIGRFYHSLFVPLCEEMQAHAETTEKFWGRYFTYYASPITRHSMSQAHENFINVQHDYTIEFRLAKFQNAKQYMQVVKFCRDITNAIIENFIKHFNDTDFDKTRYATATAYRKHKANVTAQKIVKLYQKYTAEI